MKNYKFDYDFENDSLFLYSPDSKSKASVEFDNLIIDYNAKKEIVAIELLCASEFVKNALIFEHRRNFLWSFFRFMINRLRKFQGLKSLVDKDEKVTKDFLNKLVSCSIDFIPSNSFLVLKLYFEFKSHKQISAPILIPSISKSSPAIA